jgi:outer membrane protein TolC
MKGKKFLLLSCIILSLTNSYAQEKLSLSLADAKSYALSYNRTLKSSDLAVQKAEAAKWQAIASMLPHVDATLGYNNCLGYKMVFQMEGLGERESPIDPTGTLNVKATMAISGMQIVAVQLSKLAAEMSKISYNLSDLDVKANVTTSYFAVLVTEESKRLLESSKENLTRLYETTAKMYEVGMAEQTAVDQLDVQVGLVENEVKKAERNVELAYNALRLVLGTNGQEFQLTETLENFLTNNDVYTTATSEFDINQNYNVQLLNQNIELSKKQLNLKRWEYGPTLALFYQYANIKYFGDEPMMKSTVPNTVGAQLTIPIFSSGERWSKVKQAKFDVKTAEITREDAVEGLLVQEKQLRFLLKSAIETYELQKKNVSVSERIFKNTVQKYELGTVSSTELTTINNNLVSAQGSYIGALMDLLSAQVNLQKLLNQL